MKSVEKHSFSVILIIEKKCKRRIMLKLTNSNVAHYIMRYYTQVTNSSNRGSHSADPNVIFPWLLFLLMI